MSENEQTASVGGKVDEGHSNEKDYAFRKPTSRHNVRPFFFVDSSLVCFFLWVFLLKNSKPTFSLIYAFLLMFLSLNHIK